MMIIVHWLVSALAIGLASYILPGVTVDPLGALVLAVILGLINVFIRPILFWLTLPINIVTLGLFSLIINALLIMLADYLVEGFAVSGFWSAFFFSLLLSLINALFGLWTKKA